MGNEANTENLVRDSLRENGYYGDVNIIVEEKISASPKINKLLENASKSGNKNAAGRKNQGIYSGKIRC